MKKILTLIASLLLTLGMYSQSPQKISYQTVIRNTSNALLSNTTVHIQISVLQGASTGTAVYVETHTATTNTNGLASIEIGGGTPTTGTFAGINWANGPFFIKTETDPSGGVNYSITGTSQILSVPYALSAKTAENVPTNVSALNNDAGYIATEVDGSITNEIQNISQVLTTGNNANGNNMVNVGKLGVGTANPAASAALEINSSTGALLLPRMTTAQRNALTPQEGMLIYNTDLVKFQGYINGSTSSILHNDNAAINSSTSVGTDAGGTPNNVGESFVPLTSGILQNITVNVNRASSDAVVCYIYSGIGYGGTLLGQVNTILSATGAFVIDLSSQNINLQSGQNYSFRLYSAAGFSTCPIIFHMTNSMSTNATYAQGTYLNYVGNADSNADLWFEIHIGSPSVWIDLH